MHLLMQTYSLLTGESLQIRHHFQEREFPKDLNHYSVRTTLREIGDRIRDQKALDKTEYT